jgi:hypothetical protein
VVSCHYIAGNDSGIKSGALSGLAGLERARVGPGEGLAGLPSTALNSTASGREAATSLNPLGHQLKGTVDDKRDGTYVVQCTPRNAPLASGIWEMSVRIYRPAPYSCWEHVAGSPFR